MQSAALSDQLRRVAQRRVLFGHQSVGANILEGLQRLTAEQPGEAPRLTATDEPLDGPAFAHVLIGSNEKPRSKIAHFDRLMSGSAGDWAEIAFFKFCYVDFKRETDVRDLFESYRRAHEARARTHTRKVFLHVTAPLTAMQRGPRRWAKLLLGPAAWGRQENSRRHQYNELLRQAYAGREPLFDLASVEAPGGESLARRYTDDGAHLNATGQVVVARELVALLATI